MHNGQLVAKRQSDRQPGALYPRQESKRGQGDYLEEQTCHDLQIAGKVEASKLEN
jgi:hypothetical protein